VPVAATVVAVVAAAAVVVVAAVAVTVVATVAVAVLIHHPTHQAAYRECLQSHRLQIIANVLYLQNRGSD
jgi:membrane protein YdbS with pleckstrin-like domain